MKGSNARFINALRHFLGLPDLPYNCDVLTKLRPKGEPPVFWDSWPVSSVGNGPTRRKRVA